MLQSVWRPAFRPVMSNPFEPVAWGGSSPSLSDQIRNALGDSLHSFRYVTPDFAGLYQHAAGTTPVTAVGQPVGLMLDRRLGLERGPELFAGQIPNVRNAAGSSATYAPETRTISSAVMDGPSSFPRTNFDLGLQTGKVYEIDMRLSGDLGSINSVRSGTAIPLPYSGGVVKGVFAAVDPSVVIFQSSKQPFSVTIDHFSVRELPGNHASQATTTARPALRDSPLRIDYDGVDDYLRTVFPALGSNVTIARSIPGVGAQILTGQTIAAGNWDDNVDSCATLVIDRALTPSELMLVTAFLNQRAGV